MRERSVPSTRQAHGRRTTYTVDVVVFSPRGSVLGMLCTKHRDRRAVPWGTPQANESLERCARRLVRELVGGEPSWMEQVGAFADGRRHASGAEMSIAFVAVMPVTDVTAPHAEWCDPGDLGALSPRQRAMAEAALTALRARMDRAPVAFRLLPPQFTLGELQETYELLLGKRLHKASFRRALQAAYLVEPIDEWRSEGRGRPAQFYQFAPRKRRSARRGVRFDTIA